MSEDKKKRRQWLYEIAKNIMATNETSFELDKLTEEANLFCFLYGYKQFLADCLAVQKPVVLTTAEIVVRLENRFANLCNEDFKIVHTESGFYFKDPNAVATKRTSGITQSKIYDYFIAKGHTHEEALAAVDEMKQ